MDVPNTYSYLDGNANSYTINESSLYYDPVSKEKSSSGSYSGGEPKTVEISASEFRQIENLIATAESNVDSHIKNRVMMSGEIVILHFPTTTRIILRPGCIEQQNLENALKLLLKQ